MGLSTQFRNTGRFLTLVIAVLAVIALGSSTWWYFTTHYRPSEKPPEGRPAFAFDSPDDLYFSGLLRMRYQEVIAPAGSDDTPVNFDVEQGETASGIASRLEEQGFISDASLFKAYVRFHKLDANLEAGEHVLRRTMNMEQVAHELMFAQLREIQITILPGWRIEQIAEMLTEKTGIDAQEFLLIVQTGRFN